MATLYVGQKNVVSAAVKTEMHIKRKERERRRQIWESMRAVEEVYNPSWAHLGKRKENEEFETRLFDIAILHHGRGISKEIGFGRGENYRMAF